MPISTVTIYVALHPWCHDEARDAEVRAAEDGRDRPLPTLEECLGMLPKIGSATSGVEHENKGERMTKQSPTARPCGGTDQAPSGGEPGGAANGLRGRVAELEAQLESVADRAAAAETALAARTSTAGEGFREAPAASGGGEGEPDYYVYKNELGMIVYTSQKLVNDGWGGCTVERVYKAPPQPRGWLTGEERLALDAARTILDGGGRTNIGVTIDALLARSSPPEVVLPLDMGRRHGNEQYCLGWEDGMQDARSALAAAGVAVKEVGRE